MGAEEDAFYEIAGNNITVMPSPTSGLDCVLTVNVPEDQILPSLTLEGWRSVKTVGDVQCSFPFTVTGLDTNLTFYDCAYRVGSEEGGVGNGTLEDGYGPKSPWCAMVPTLGIDDMEAEDADELLDFCETQDQLPLISVSTNDDVALDFGAYNSLTVFGSAMNVNLGGVSAANVDISLSEGEWSVRDPNNLRTAAPPLFSLLFSSLPFSWRLMSLALPPPRLRNDPDGAP